MFKTILYIVVAIFLSQCSQLEIDEAALSQIKSNMTNTSFSTKLWLEVDAAEKDKNYFVSPTSLQLALGLLLNGANGVTQNEIKTTLGLSALDIETLNENYKNLQASLPNLDSGVKLSIANAIWSREGFPISKSFTTKSQDIYKAEAVSLPFDAAAVAKINAWADKNTNGKIKKVLDKISDNEVMLLMNALYFKGDWTKPFDKNATTEEDFKGSSKTTLVKMMNKNETVGYYKNENLSALELPYGKEGNFSMILLLPNEAKNYGNVLKTIDLSKLKFTDQKVIVKIPKFTMEYEISLNNILQNMGIKTAFTDQADLLGLIEGTINQKLFLTFVKQNTFVAVDEVGTEAAAVTTIGVGVTSAPVDPTTFICNRPFYFLIQEKQTGQILFLGSIKNL